MGDSRRFDLFAKVIRNNFPVDRYSIVADVAGGKGYLQTALRSYGYEVITFDQRRKKQNKPGKFKYQYRWFNSTVNKEFDLLVGMHPDEATDVIIIEAARRNVPFVICPCCVKPCAEIYWGKHSYLDWIVHLKKLARRHGFSITESILKMNGKNIVLIGRKSKII